MNITFLIGNGFDIGLGMKSSFSDFFPQYIEKAKKKKKLFKDFAHEIDENRKEWSYFELQIGQYAKHFSIETKDELLQQFQDFEMEFIAYLKEEEKKISFSQKERIESVMKEALMNFYHSRNLPIFSSNRLSNRFRNKRTEEHQFNFINFNYTSALRKCLETIQDGIVYSHMAANGRKNNKIGKVVHVHGTLEQYPIMGPNDASQIANEELANDPQFIQYILKPYINDALRMNYDIDSIEIINNSDIICIYGMSLGATDKIWWKRILSWLSKPGLRELVIFAYDEKFTSSNHFQRIQKNNEIYNTLIQYSENESIDMESIKERIHIAVHRNIFEIKGLREKQETKRPSTNQTLMELIDSQYASNLSGNMSTLMDPMITSALPTRIDIGDLSQAIDIAGLDNSITSNDLLKATEITTLRTKKLIEDLEKYQDGSISI